MNKLELIESLMNVCCEHCNSPVGKANMHKHKINENYCDDRGIMSDELALNLLNKFGYADKEDCGCFRLRWDKLKIDKENNI